VDKKRSNVRTGWKTFSEAFFFGAIRKSGGEKTKGVVGPGVQSDQDTKMTIMVQKERKMVKKTGLNVKIIGKWEKVRVRRSHIDDEQEEATLTDMTTFTEDENDYSDEEDNSDKQKYCLRL
jgi:hypothetical protein